MVAFRSRFRRSMEAGPSAMRDVGHADSGTVPPVAVGTLSALIRAGRPSRLIVQPHPDWDQPVVDGHLGQRRVEVADGRHAHHLSDGLRGDAQTRRLGLTGVICTSGRGSAPSAATLARSGSPRSADSSRATRLFRSASFVDRIEKVMSRSPRSFSLNARTSGMTLHAFEDLGLDLVLRLMRPVFSTCGRQRADHGQPPGDVRTASAPANGPACQEHRHGWQPHVQVARGRRPAQHEDVLDALDILDDPRHGLRRGVRILQRRSRRQFDRQEMRLTSSGGMKLPGICAMKKSDTASTPKRRRSVM
jgi:hypothetical protein